MVKISHGRAASFGKSQQLLARWEMFGQAPGLGENLARIRSLHSGKINNSARQPSGKVSSSRRGGKCLDRRRDLVKIPHVHRQPSGKVNNSARQPSGKVSSSRRGWKMFGSVAGPGENSTRTPPALGKSQQLCSWAKMAADNLGAGCGRAVPGPAWPLPRCPAPRAAHMRSASLHIDCACALPVPRHFLATWRRPSTFSVASPPTHAGSRCQGCGLPSA